MDYGRFKYETAKKEREERSKRTVIEVKEMKFRPKTDEHDFDFKVKHIREFLGEGNKAKLVIQFRGREIVHPEVGQSVLRRVVEACQDIGQVEQHPIMEGRRMLMIIGPKGSAASKPRPTTPTPATPGAGAPGAGAPSAGAPSAGASAAGAPAAGAPAAGAPAAGAPAAAAPAAAAPATAAPAAAAPAPSVPAAPAGPVATAAPVATASKPHA